MNGFLKELILPLFWFFFLVAFNNDKEPVLAKKRIEVNKDYSSGFMNVNYHPKSITSMVSYFISQL